MSAHDPLGVHTSLQTYPSLSSQLATHLPQAVQCQTLNHPPSSVRDLPGRETRTYDTPYQYRPKPDKIESNQEDVDLATETCQSPQWGDAAKECSQEDRERLYNTTNIRKVVDAMAGVIDQLTLAQTTNLPNVSETIFNAMEAHKTELTKTIEERPDWNRLLQLPPDQHPSSFTISAWAHPATASHCPDSVAILLNAVPIGSREQASPFQTCNSILATAQLKYDQSQQYVSWVTVNTGPAYWTEEGMDRFWLSRVGVPPQTYSSMSVVE